jgi:hypothetical protein
MIGDYSNPTWAPGETLTAAKMQAITNKIYELDQYLVPRYIKKASNESVNNTTTVQDDNDFSISFSSAQTGVYEIEANIATAGNADVGLRLVWAVTGGVSQKTKRHRIGSAELTPYDTRDAQVTLYDVNLSTESVYSTNPTYEGCIRERFLINVASSGTLKMRWAQWTARVSDLFIYDNSYMKITKMIAWS